MARILIVDDDPTLLRLLSLRLREEGHAVIEAASAEAALAKLDRELPQLVPGDEPGEAWREAVLTRSPRMQQLLAEARPVAQSGASVLVEGASGTGKELLASAIHAASPRSSAPFVPVNCVDPQLRPMFKGDMKKQGQMPMSVLSPPARPR